ncbi:MAG: NAD-dependent succinate-semialdehyde dehydrogenase [Candidatus Pelagibacter sp. TMED64]|nr:NAD-dependent succinate-semialdehyde dehydrogenase [Candidatus Pelagibacter sp.]OUU65823.1 MAG: NAD-dependent succinate-semialdehyde dehydrogenase [Candidatus Pelagibacter sp. TMED64]
MYSKFGQFIEGKWQSSEKKETYDVINPATEEVIGKASKASSVDVEKALKSAKNGFELWKKVSPWERANIIKKIADLIRKKNDKLAKWMTLETGKPMSESLAEVSGTADIFEWNAEETKRIYGQTVQSRFNDTRVIINYEPVGVVAALSPWNFPLILAARKISTALAAGCSVICKPDIITPGTVMELVDIVNQCGVPPGTVNLLSGDPASIASQLISSDIIKKISLTGSTRVGKIILKQAAEKIQRVTMELSGHAPFIVYEDANIEKATDIAIAAKYRNNGQVCISPSRFYIHESKKDEFVKSFVDKTLKLKIGNGMDANVQLGPITTKKRLEEIEKLVEITKKEGAKVLCGGKRPSGFNKGYFYEPTVFDDVKDNFTIMTEEPFGPLTPILKFKNFDEVIKKANDQVAGLASYVCTGSIELATKTSESLETGMVAINTPFISNAETPFGGIKQSGYGREGGSMGIKDYLNIKYTHLGITN